jgi:putative transposase
MEVASDRWSDDQGAAWGGKAQAQTQHRRKPGTKRSLLVEGNGIPVGLTVDGANRHDMKLTKPTLESIAVERPEPTRHQPQNICMDKGYDYAEVHELLQEWGYTIHIRS